MIIELNREEEFRKQNKRFSDAIALFESFIKKYARMKKLKKAHLTKNKTGKYIGEIIFIDMINSYSYTREEKELLFQSLISMPPRSLYDFEQLYIKSSKSKLKSFIKEMEKHQEDSKELYKTNEIAYYVYNQKKIIEDISNFRGEKLMKRERKYGKYTFMYPEFDEALKQRNEYIRGFKTQTIRSIVDKHYTAEKYPNLSKEEFEKFKKGLYKKVMRAYSNDKRRSH
jgi:hypothetical protein